MASWIAGPSISTRGTDGRGSDRIRDASEYIYCTLRNMPSSGQWSIPRWRVIDQFVLSFFIAYGDTDKSALKQLSFKVEQRGHQQPSTLGPFHVAVFNRIRKVTGGQKLSEVKVFMPKVLNVGDGASGSKQGGRGKTKTTGDGANALAAFLKEIGMTANEWNMIKETMQLLASGKLKRTTREVTSSNASIRTRAGVFWVRSQDLFSAEKGGRPTSDRLAGVMYSFAISYVVHATMIDPTIDDNDEWLWEAWQCRTSFEHQIASVLKCDDADWIWADHIPVPDDQVERPANARYLESVYEKRIKSFGASTMEHIEQLNATAKAVVNAAGRFRLHNVDDETRQQIAMLTNDFVEVIENH